VIAEGTVITRLLIGTGLGYLVGFERALRGSVAGDRAFSLVGAASAGITAVAFKQSPQTVAGVVTGIGFIGAGVVVHGQSTLIRGITTAATVFATAAIGILVGTGAPVAGVVLTALCLLVLEIRHVPFLKVIDSQHYVGRFKQEGDEPNDPED